MGFGDFWLQSNNNNKGKKFSLKDLQTLKPEDIAKNPKLQKLITLFDSDGSGNLETLNTKGGNELESIFSKFSSVARDNQILEEIEVSEYLKENNLENTLSVADVFDFLGKFIKSNADEDVKQADNEVISEFIRELEAYIQNRASQHTMTDAEFNKIKKEAYNTVLTSTISTEKTEKDYDDLFTFAKEKLSESGKTPTSEELTLHAAELQMLNPDVKADKKIKKGVSINIPAKSIDKKNVEILKSKGIRVEKDNYIFFQKLLELDDTKQAVVLNIIKNSKFTTKEEVINEIYTKTKINLADTGLTIKVGGVSSTLENFITKTLKLDLSSQDGLKIYNRLCSLGKDASSVQATLNSFPKEFIDKLSKMSNITFDKLADKAEVFGIIIRTDDELKEQEKNSQEYRDLKARMFMAQYVADNYSSAVTISQSADRNLNFTQGAWWVRNARPIGYTSNEQQKRDTAKVNQIKKLIQDVDTLSNEEFTKKISAIMEAERTVRDIDFSLPGEPSLPSYSKTKDPSFKFDPKLAYKFMKQMQKAELAASVAKRLEPERKQKGQNNPYVAVQESTRVHNTQVELASIEYTVEPFDKEELKQLTRYIKSIKTKKELFLFAKSLHYKVDVISNKVETMIPKENQAEIAELLEQKAKELGFAEPTRPNSISLDTFRNIFTKPIDKKVNYPKTNEKTIMETYEATKTKLLGNWDPVGEQIRTQEMEGTVGGVLDIATMILVTKGMGSMGAFVRIGNVGRNIGTATSVFKTANVASRFTKNAALINRLAKADKVLGGLWVNGAAGALHGAATMGAYGGLQGTVGMADNTIKNLLEGKEWSDGLGERFEQTLVMGYENAKFGLFAGYSGVLAQALGKGTVALGSKGIDKLFKTNYSKTVLDKVSSVVTKEGISGSEFWTKMHAVSKAEGLVGFGYETGFFTLYHKMEEAGVDFNNEESLLTYLQNNLDEETKQSLGATYVSEAKNLAMFKMIGSLIQWVHIGKMSSSAAMELQANNNRALRNMNMRKVVENGKESYLVKFNENDKPIKVAPEQLMQLCEHKMFCADAEDKAQKDGSFKLPNNQTIEYDKAKKVYRTVIDAENTVESTSVEDLLVKINQTTFRNQINGQIFKDGQPATVKSLLKLVMTQNGEPIKINDVEIKPEEVLENSEVLDNVKIAMTKVNGKEVYVITLADGKTIQETSLEGLMSTCESFFQLELMKSALEGVNKGVNKGVNGVNEGVILKASVQECEAKIVQKFLYKLRMNSQGIAINVKVGYLDTDLNGKPLKDKEKHAAVMLPQDNTLIINRYFLENVVNRINENINTFVKDGSIVKVSDGKYAIAPHLRNAKTTEIEAKLNNIEGMSLDEQYDFCTSDVAYLKNLNYQTTRFPDIALERIYENADNIALLKSKGIYIDTEKLDNLSKEELYTYLKQVTQFVKIPDDIVLEPYSGIVVIHEDGHLKHYKNMTAEQREDFVDFNINFTFKFPHVQRIAAKVSVRACENPKEFVAEVYSGISNGQVFPKDVMDLYEQYHGPKVAQVKPDKEVNKGSKPDEKTNVVSENSAEEIVTSEETKPQNPATTSGSGGIQSFAEISNDFAQNHKSYDLYSDNDGNNVVMIVAVAGERPNPRAGIPFTYEVYRFDKDGNQIAEPLRGLSEKEAKKYQLENKQFIDNRVSDNSGTLNSFIIPLPKIVRDALFKENGNSRKVDTKSQPIVEPSSNNGFGLEVQKATGFLGKDKIFFNGQKVATTKKELKQQLKDAGVGEYEIERLFKYVIKGRKDKQVIERLSIIFRDHRYGVNDKAEKYLDLAKTEEEAAILNMLITIDANRLDQSFTLIKKRPFLYDFLRKGADIIKQQAGINGSTRLYAIEDVMPGIKTEHQSQAVLEVLKKLGNNDTSYLRNFINKTVSVCVKTESDIPKFAEFARKYKDGTNNHYIDITKDEETILKYWELLSDSKTGITPRALGQLCYNPEVVDYAIQLKNTGIRNELFQYLVSKGTKINLNELLADKPDMYTVLQRVAQVDRGINETLKLLNRLTQNPDGSRNQDALNLGLKLIDFDMNAIHTGNNSVEFLYAPGWSHFHNILSMCKNSDGSFNAKKMSLVNSLIDNGFIDYQLHHNSVMDDVKAILDKYSDDFDYDGFINKFIQYGIPKKTIASLLMRDLSTAKGIIETIETLYESKNYSNDNIMLAINRMLDSKENNSTILAEQLRDPELQVWFNRKDETKRQGLSYENLSNELIEELSSKDITQEKLQKIKEKFIILGSFRDSRTADWKKYEELIQNIYGIQDPKQLIEGLKSFNYFGTNPVMITHFIQKGNFDTYKEVFEILNSKYIEEDTCRKIALGCNKESVQDIINAFALLDEEYNITRYQDRNNKPNLPQKVWDNLIEGNQENFKAIIELYRMFKGDSRITQDFKTELLSVSHENLDLIKELYTRFKNSSISIEDFQNFVKLGIDYQKFNIQDLILNMLKEGKSYSEISMEVFKSSVDETLNTPLPESYNPENAYTLDPRNSQRKFELTSDKKGMQLVPLETVKKPYKLLNLPSNKELIAALDRGEPVVIDIPDEGGMKPVKGNTSIAQDDIPSLGVVESAEVDLVYAVKRNWSNRKIARDIYQNSHDGHGGTLEGVQLSIQKVDGKYKVRLSGKSTYSYDFLKYMGATIKNMATDSAGKYGEGTKIVAASLLAKESTDYVRYASGDWTFEFNRSSDDVKTAEMTRKLTKNETPIDGNYIEFTTSDADLVESMLEAKDYFEHPYNKDFQNADFENEFFAIKILPPEEQGNIYMVQRYESYGNFENSLDGFTLVFKVKSEDVALSSKSKDAWVLPSDRDRSGLSDDDIKNMFNKYAKTMSDEDLVKLIATMEPLWNGSSRPSYLGRDIVETLAKIAEDRNLKIDFSSYHYVYASEALDREFAKNMGYTPISIKAFTKIGLDDLSGASKAKTALKPTETQEAKIKLLNEGARLIAQTLSPNDPTKMSSEEADAPKFVFNDGGLKGEGGEAIIDWSLNSTYEGHWIKSTMLDMNGVNCRFADVLATWLHEMTHKYGGDNSVEFTEAIKNLENHIIKVLVDNPDALAKFKYLAEKYDEVGGSSFIERTVDTDFSVESYRKEILDEVSSLKEYKEYSEYVSSRTLQAPTRPVPEYKKLEPDMSKTYPEPLPTAEELSKQLKETGHVELSVPDLGGMKPTEDPAIIHEEDIPILGKAQKTTNTILYGQQLGWSPFKVARDIIQNFYDGNGHTMEGVTIKIERDGNKYKVRIEGKSKYDYNYLKNTGRGTKGYLVYDIGGFGEGAKVTALSLLAQGSNNVRYGSGSWTTDFHTTKTRIDTQEVDIMARTLSKADKDFDGSFMEFETSDTELVEQLLASKDFFVQPFNPGTQNLTFENKYFGFKFEENIPEKIILGQQFDISNDLKSDRYNSKPRLQLVFKLLPNNPEVMSFDNGKELKLTSTGVDRGNLDVSDAYKLCDRYVKTMSDADIMQTLATLEKYWISENPYYTEYNRDNSLETVFLTSVAEELYSRWGSTDIFHNQKLVYIDATSAEGREKAQWLKENGYRFVRQEFRSFVLDGNKEYDKQHSLHSTEPTQAEVQKLEIIRKAVLEIGKQNTLGLKLDISNIPIYIYDAEVTKNPPIHARIVNRTCTGIFIDRKILETQEFTQTVQEVMAQILHYSGVDETSTYSYELTDLMAVEFEKFITDPNIVQKIHALRSLYENVGK